MLKLDPAPSLCQSACIDVLQEYISLAVRLGIDQDFREEAVAKVEGGYRESLHQQYSSAQEWAAFFLRSHRGAAFNEKRRAGR